MASRLAASVRAVLLNCELNSDVVVHIELMSTTVGLAGSTAPLDRR